MEEFRGRFWNILCNKMESKFDLATLDNWSCLQEYYRGKYFVIKICNVISGVNELDVILDSTDQNIRRITKLRNDIDLKKLDEYGLRNVKAIDPKKEAQRLIQLEARAERLNASKERDEIWRELQKYKFELEQLSAKFNKLNRSYKNVKKVVNETYNSFKGDEKGLVPIVVEREDLLCKVATELYEVTKGSGNVFKFYPGDKFSFSEILDAYEIYIDKRERLKSYKHK